MQKARIVFNFFAVKYKNWNETICQKTIPNVVEN